MYSFIAHQLCVLASIKAQLFPLANGETSQNTHDSSISLYSNLDGNTCKVIGLQCNRKGDESRVRPWLPFLCSLHSRKEPPKICIISSSVFPASHK